jgi:hypothetical protein
MLADDARIERLVKVAEMYYSKNMNSCIFRLPAHMELGYG